jgi:hypothetical protein
MHFPKHWSRGSHRGFSCWRWSDTSQEEAASLAGEAARQLAARFESGEELGRGYGYPDRPMREPVLRELKLPGGELTAVITRNSYGCLVLNTTGGLFVDVDLPERPASGNGWIKRLFGKPAPRPADGPETRVLDQARAWTQSHPGWGWRIYRTRAGLRLLATHAVMAPDAALTDEVFEALGADPLYRRLCRTQRCFRARLTPKPWRCGCPKPPVRWPWSDAAEEARFNGWERDYLKAAERHATCQLITTVGNPDWHPALDNLIAMHDAATNVPSKLTLA